MSMSRLMLMVTSRRRSPSTRCSRSITSRTRAVSSSVHSRTRRSRSTPARLRMRRADERPIPKMYVKATSPRLSRGRSTPAKRAICLSSPCRASALALLVARVRADDAHDTLAPDHLALLTSRPDRRPYLHRALRPPCLSRVRLLEPVRNATTRQIVGGQLDLDPIAGQDADEVQAHLARDVRQHAVAVVELDPEHRVRQGLDDLPLHLDRVVLGLLALPLLGQLTAPPPGHQAASFTSWVNTSGPRSVTATVCSKCAARLPSAVTAVHRSASTRTSQCPIVTIGSMASTIPTRSNGPRPGSPKFGTCGSS